MKLKTVILGLVIAFFGVSVSYSNTTLAVGDIQITGVTSDSDDSFSFVFWKDISANTVIRFMDHSFTATQVRANENDMSLTFTGALTAGTVVRVVDGAGTLVNGGAFTGTKTGTLGNISNDGDQVFIYQGAAVGDQVNVTKNFDGTLLYGLNIADTDWKTSGAANEQSSYRPAAISGLEASLDTGSSDNADYAGTRTGMTTAAYRAAIGNLSNYTQSNTRFNLATGGFTSTASVGLHWDSDGTGVGNGGGGTWDTTTQSRFKNGAAGTTYLQWVNSSTGNDHTAVFGGTAGTVSLAAGGVIASGLTFDVSGYTIQSHTLTLAGSTPTVSVPTAAHSATISSTLAGSNGLVKSGAGMLKITGTNSTNIGATSVTAGTLAVGVGGIGSLTSAVTVSNAATKLSGSGTITGNVEINNGAILAPGDSVGKLTTVGTTTLNTGSIFEWELASSPAVTGRGTAYDAVNTTGLAATTGAIFRVVLSGTQNFSETFWNTNRTWTDIFTNVAGSSSLSIASIFTGGVQYYNATNGVLSSPAATQGAFTFNGTDLKWTAVPEPTSALAGLLLGAGLMRRRRGA